MQLLAIALTFPKETQMQQRKILNRMLGVAVLAMLFGTGSAYAQAAKDAGSTSSSAGGASSGTATAKSDTKSSSVSKSDQNMMRDMAYSNLSEIATAKIALERSQNDKVKSFAQKMIDDHTQAQKDLEQLAQAKGVTLPTEPDAKHKATAKTLSALEGDKFDKMYMSQGGSKDHRDTHKLLMKAEKSAKDPDLKALASKTAPIVDQHLSMAEDMTGKKSTSSGSSGTSGSSAAGGASGSAGSAGSSSGASGK
jgi:putative membrane protein